MEQGQSQARLAPPETQTEMHDAESCEVVGISYSQLQHTHGQSVSHYGKGWWSWLQILGGHCSSATLTTTLPLSL